MRKKNLAKETSSKCLFDMKINVHRKRKDWGVYIKQNHSLFSRSGQYRIISESTDLTDWE
jgi:hypothetical protein